jgi:hypothetical protein
MNKNGLGVTTIIVTAIIFCMVRDAAAQQSSAAYDKDGRFVGSAIQHSQSPGNTGTSFYGNGGQFTGSAIPHGNSTSLYNRNGHFQGTVTNTSPGRR